MIGISFVVGRTARPFDGDPGSERMRQAHPLGTVDISTLTFTGRNEVEDGEAVALGARSGKIAASSKAARLATGTG